MLYGENREKGRPTDIKIYPVSFKYLHGKLEELNGCDFIYSDNEEESRRLNEEQVIEDIDIILEGVKRAPRESKKPIKARIYTWYNHEGLNLTTGLIVLKDDKESVEYAEKCFKEKKEYI